MSDVKFLIIFCDFCFGVGDIFLIFFFCGFFVVNCNINVFGASFSVFNSFSFVVAIVFFACFVFMKCISLFGYGFLGFSVFVDNIGLYFLNVCFSMFLFMFGGMFFT